MPLNSRALNSSDNANFALFCAARKLFGSWDAALKAAGLHPAEIRKKPTNQYTNADKVIIAIKKRNRNKLPLNYRAVLNGTNRDSSLVRYACKYFGSWDNALKAAGLDPKKIRLR